MYNINIISRLHVAVCISFLNSTDKHGAQQLLFQRIQFIVSLFFTNKQFAKKKSWTDCSMVWSSRSQAAPISRCHPVAADGSCIDGSGSQQSPLYIFVFPFFIFLREKKRVQVSCIYKNLILQCVLLGDITSRSPGASVLNPNRRAKSPRGRES